MAARRARFVTTLTGSALLALALLHGRLDGRAGWAAAHVDEDWNMEFWGRDELALERRAARFAEMQAAAWCCSRCERALYGFCFFSVPYATTVWPCNGPEPAQRPDRHHCAPP